MKDIYKKTSKSVRDHGQSASLNTNTMMIKVTNRQGRRVISKYEFHINDYLNAPGGFNKSYNRNKFIQARNPTLSETDCLHVRIFDSQMYAIDDVIKAYNEAKGDNLIEVTQ